MDENSIGWQSPKHKTYNDSKIFCKERDKCKRQIETLPRQERQNRGNLDLSDLQVLLRHLSKYPIFINMAGSDTSFNPTDSTISVEFVLDKSVQLDFGESAKFSSHLGEQKGRHF